MNDKDELFQKKKETALKKLRLHGFFGRVDRGIIDIVDMINSMRDYYTTSSCEGRIQVADIPPDHKKTETRILFKSHDVVPWDALSEKINTGFENILWLMFQPPILHVIARDVSAADRFIKIGKQAGFKQSCALSLKPFPMMEIRDRMDMSVPLGINGKLIMSDEQMRSIYEIGLKKFESSKRRIKQLYRLVVEASV